MSNNVFKFEEKYVYYKTEEKIIKYKYNNKNIYLFLHKINKYLTKKLLINFIETYNDYFEKNKQIIIYDVNELEFEELYTMILLSLKYPKIQNIQEYFGFNFLKLIINYRKNSFHHLNKDIYKINRYSFNSFLLKKNIKKLIIEQQLNFNENKLENIMGISKGSLRIIKEISLQEKYKNKLFYEKTFSIKDITQLEKENNLKYIHSLLKVTNDFNGLILQNINTNIKSLINSHGFKDKELFNFIQELKEEKNIEKAETILILLNEYNDYLNMRNELKKHNIDVKQYPKKTFEIKEKHNEIINIFNELKNKNILLNDFYNNLNIEEYKNNKYTIFSPKESKEIHLEGKSLNHCVGSYVDKIKKGNCLIYFLRDNENIEKPLVTIEINIDKKMIVQIKGKHNRKATYEESSFIKKWAKQNKLKVGGYY